MYTELYTRIDKITEELRLNLYQKALVWTKTRTSSELFDFEQDLQKTLNILQAKIVGAILEDIHQDTAFVEECQEQVISQCKANRNGQRNAQVQTLSGYQIQIRTPYSISSKNVNQDQKGKRKRKKGVGLYPVLRRLGIINGYTPRLLSENARQCVDGPSITEASERLVNREIGHNRISMWRSVQDFASIALWQRSEAVNKLALIKATEPAALAGKRVVVGLDGGRIGIRVNKKTKDQTKTRDYTGSNCEPKLFVIYTIDQKGFKEHKENLIFDGTIQSAEYLFALLELRLKQMGITQAELLVIIGDGAPWIWNGISKLRATLGLENIRVFEIVDFAHSVGKLATPAKMVTKKNSQQRGWFKRMRNLLKNGHVDKVITALLNLDDDLAQNDDIHKAIEYFQTHKTRMQYAKFQVEGLPIGSGVIESGVRRIVNMRMKGASMFWYPENAEGVLYLRCQVKGGQWQAFFKSVLSQWTADMTVSLAQARQIMNEISAKFLEAHPPEFVDNSRNEAINWACNLLEAGEAVIIDTETTGLDEDDEIIQLSIIDLQGNVLLETLFRPTKPISLEASAVHGINAQDVAKASTFAELYEKITDLIYKQDLVAYNADFDRRMMVQTCKRYGLPDFEFEKWHCAMEKYAHFWGERRKNGDFRQQSLTNACIQQNIAINSTHQATEDCLLTLELIRTYARDIGMVGFLSWAII